MVLDLATANNIVLFRLSAHSTHLTQPLDVGVFQPYKHYHAEAIDNAVRMGDSEFGKLEFLAAFQTFRTQTFKPSTIRHAFRTCGIVPFNPNMVLDIIRQKVVKSAYQPRTPSPPPQLVERTPQGPESIRRFGRKLERGLKDVGSNGGTMTKKVVDRFQRFVRGAIISADALDLATRDLDMIQRARISRQARAGLGGQVAAKGGVMKVSQCRKLCSIRQKKEDEKVKRKEERDAKKKSGIGPKKNASASLAAIEYLLDLGLKPDLINL